eukprot:1958233-Pyramimonas_sp.AAC.2
MPAGSAKFSTTRLFRARFFVATYALGDALARGQPHQCRCRKRQGKRNIVSFRCRAGSCDSQRARG